MGHIPVLQKEVLKYLDPKPNENFIDCTFGQGGHSKLILDKNGPKGKVLGIEIDPMLSKKRPAGSDKRLILANGSYAGLKEVIKKNKAIRSFKSVSGILIDLGISSWHIEKSGRGFSFKRDEELDMRYDPQNPLDAKKILNFWSRQEIEKTLREYGEERYASEIAEEIIRSREARPIRKTFQLVEIIESVVPKNYRHGKIHFATRTFQALRIAVNDELQNLEKVLPQASSILKNGGRLAVISFHSLEDRIVKNFFRQKAKEGSLKVLTKKPISPTFQEIKNNPRARSAKLRAAIKQKIKIIINNNEVKNTQ